MHSDHSPAEGVAAPRPSSSDHWQVLGLPAPDFMPADPWLAAVEASIGYIRRPAQAAFTLMYDPPEGIERENFIYQNQRVLIADARSFSPSARIHREGFEIWDAPAATVDFHDPQWIAALYLPQCVELACQATGATQGFVFDHQIRRREEGRPALTFGRHGDGSRPAAVGRVHNDYNEASGRKRLGMVIHDPQALARVRRYSIVNIWRSIGGPVQDTPLALCDARSVSTADLVATQIRYTSRVGGIYLLEYSPTHRWAYFRRWIGTRPLSSSSSIRSRVACRASRRTPPSIFRT